MKLLKYVMTHDSGLAPNPYFRVCSLAVCTPNHKNARLDVGDWVIGHSIKSRGHKLIYSMRLTSVLSMPEYFSRFPQKRPKVDGLYEERAGDNIYYVENDKWMRVPSAGHNDEGSFKQDINRKIYIAEGNSNFWYFGGITEYAGEFGKEFPSLIQSRQGFSYIRDIELIDTFAAWLRRYGKNGLIGNPRDRFTDESSDTYLVSIDPEVTVSLNNFQLNVSSDEKSLNSTSTTAEHESISNGAKRNRHC